jgi:hypothetical protein
VSKKEIEKAQLNLIIILFNKHNPLIDKELGLVENVALLGHMLQTFSRSEFATAVMETKIERHVKGDEVDPIVWTVYRPSEGVLNTRLL